MCSSLRCGSLDIISSLPRLKHSVVIFWPHLLRAHVTEISSDIDTKSDPQDYSLLRCSFALCPTYLLTTRWPGLGLLFHWLKKVWSFRGPSSKQAESRTVCLGKDHLAVVGVGVVLVIGQKRIVERVPLIGQDIWIHTTYRLPLYHASHQIGRLRVGVLWLCLGVFDIDIDLAFNILMAVFIIIVLSGSVALIIVQCSMRNTTSLASRFASVLFLPMQIRMWVLS